MSFAKIALALPLVFAVIFAGKSCDISLDSIGDYVVTYDLVITNTASEPALVLVKGSDVAERAVVQPGAAITATSYQGGGLAIAAGSANDAIARLRARKAELLAQLQQLPLDAAQSLSLRIEIAGITSELESDISTGHSALCLAVLKPDSSGKGGEFDFDVKNNFGDWSVTGYCAQ